MVLASYIRLALIGAALLFSHAQATFDFSSCADNCVTSSGCESDSARCMCKKAREVLLDSVISCLFFNCKDDLRNFDDAFLAPIEEGCVDSGRDIPRSKLRAAESLASSYIDKLPSPTTAKSTPVEVTPTPKPTKKADPTTAEVPPSSTTAEDSSPSSSSTVNRQPVGSKSTAAAVTPAAVPTPATQSSATPSESPASDDSGSGRSGGGGGGDPFSTTGGSVGSAIQPFLALLGLPVVAALLALE